MLSRRAALRGGTAVALSTEAITAAGAITARIAVEDPIVALEQQWHDITGQVRGMWAYYEKQEGKLPAWAKVGPDQIGQDRGWPDVGDLPEFQEFRSPLNILSTRPSLKEVRSYNRHTESLSGGEERKRRRAQGRARVRAWVAQNRRQEALERELGIDDIDGRVEPHLERRDGVEAEITNTPAASVEGIAAKLRLFAHYAELNPEDFVHGFALSALRDAQRLAGRAQS